MNDVGFKRYFRLECRGWRNHTLSQILFSSMNLNAAFVRPIRQQPSLAAGNS
jgi:hypothetical protein